MTDILLTKAFINNTDLEMKLLSDYRKTLYRSIDSCHDPTEKARLIAKRDDCTKVLAKFQKDAKAEHDYIGSCTTENVGRL